MSSAAKRIRSGSKWEELAGYSRAVRVGNTIHVAGTTATDERGALVGTGDPYTQTVRILEKIRDALNRLGADLDHVVRTRIYVTDIDDWEPVGRAHRELMGGAPPATTMVEVARLISPEMRVEIEAEAIVSSDD